MDWDANTIEQQIRGSSYFKDQGFIFGGTETNKKGTDLEDYIFRLDNAQADRAIEITFSPPRPGGGPAVSSVWLLKPSIDGFFILDDYVKQYHSIDLDKGFRYTDYSGTFEERVSSFLEFAEGLLRKYAEPILSGKEWPDVKFDWGGTK